MQHRVLRIEMGQRQGPVLLQQGVDTLCGVHIAGRGGTQLRENLRQEVVAALTHRRKAAQKIVGFGRTSMQHRKQHHALGPVGGFVERLQALDKLGQCSRLLAADPSSGLDRAIDLGE